VDELISCLLVRRAAPGRCPRCGHKPKPHRRGFLPFCSELCQDDLRPPCDFPPCLELAQQFGLCWGHDQQRRAGKPLALLRPSGVRGAAGLRDPEGRKLCRDCGEWRLEGDYHRRSASPDGLSPYCKMCWSARDMLSKHNITMATYQEMVAAQGGACRICREGPSRSNGDRLCIDHDHGCCPEDGRSCGRCIRGLLCGGCNVGIGMLREREDLFLRAAAYVAGTLT
jgi:hypothetical protein